MFSFVSEKVAPPLQHTQTLPNQDSVHHLQWNIANANFPFFFSQIAGKASIDMFSWSD